MHKRVEGTTQCNDIKVASAGCLIFVAARPNLASHPTQCQLHTRLAPLFIPRLDSSTEAQQQIILKIPLGRNCFAKTIFCLFYIRDNSRAVNVTRSKNCDVKRGKHCGWIKKAMPMINHIPLPLCVLNIFGSIHHWSLFLLD